MIIIIPDIPVSSRPRLCVIPNNNHNNSPRPPPPVLLATVTMAGVVTIIIIIISTARDMGFVPFKIHSIVPRRFEKQIKVGWDHDRFGSNEVNGRIGISIKFSKRPRNNKNNGNVGDCKKPKPNKQTTTTTKTNNNEMFPKRNNQPSGGYQHLLFFEDATGVGVGGLTVAPWWIDYLYPYCG